MENTTLVTMLKGIDEYEKGKTYEIDNDTAEKWISADVAEKASPSAMLDEKLAELSATIEQRDQKLVEKLTETMQFKAVAPAVHIGSEKNEKTFGRFLKAVAKRDEKTIDEYGSKVLTGQNGASGGYLIPEEFRAQLLSAAGESAFARQRCFTVPMASDTVKIPALDQSGTSSGQSNYFGGVVAAWTEVDTTAATTEPSFKEITLNARELSFHTKVHSYLLDDSALSVESILTNLFGKAIAWHIDYAILQGDGVGQPLGILNSGALKAISRTTTSDFKLADAAGMMAGLHSESEGSAVWVMSKSVQSKLIQLADAGSNAVFVPNAAQRMPMTLFGIPVVFTEKVPALGTKGDVMLCDFSAYVLGMRQELAISTSEHVDFLKGRITYRVTTRLDGQPFLSGPITLADGSTTVSPFVAVNA